MPAPVQLSQKPTLPQRGVTSSLMLNAARSLTQPRMVGTTLPIGPSVPLRQVYPVLPLVGPPTISLLRNTRYGRGVIVPVAVGNIIPAGTEITATHNLGRFVQSAQGFSNNGGALLTPALQVGTGTRQQQTFIANQDLLNALIWFY